MPFLRARAGRRSRCALLAMILSLGLTQVVSAQFVNPNKPDPKNAPIEGIATWYKVPANSRTKQRAGKDELTAAHNRLPFGTKVRVTRLSNGKNVVVCITDRGVYKRGTVIDLSKEAAEKLDMLRDGSSRVRLEILPEEKPAPPKPKWRWW